MPRPQLAVVHPAETPLKISTVSFAEAVRTVATVARRGGLVAPVYRAPPRRGDLDRTIRRRGDAAPVISIRLDGRPVGAVHSDVIEGVVVSNGLDDRRADRFRRAAWRALDGAVTQPVAARPGPAVVTAGDPVVDAGPSVAGSVQVA